ncbi:MAG: BREX system Lon protease-like protein BrxL, partial [Betaproteobacteria bacterium]
FDVDVEHQQRIGHLFGPLPPEMRDDTAFMDRIHCFLPGWDVPKLSPGLFTQHFGLVSDFLSECFTQLRNQSRVEITPDGLRITIVDDLNRPMFALGGAEVQPYMRDLLREIGGVLNTVDNKVTLSGHTDSAQYSGGERGYSNWELSSDRANASRRELIAGGMKSEKVVRVVGLADSNLSIKAHPRDPLNRRISIIVLNKIAEERMTRAGGEIEAGTIDEFEEKMPQAGSANGPAVAAHTAQPTPAAPAAVAVTPAAPAAAAGAAPR